MEAARGLAIIRTLIEAHGGTVTARSTPEWGTTITVMLPASPRDRWQHPRDVVDALPLHPGARVADIGAGAGYFTFPLARAVGDQGKVYAVDTDEDLAALVAREAGRRGLANVETVLVHPDRPALPSTVDLAVIVNTFHHLPDPATYLSTVASSLKADGHLAVIEARPHWLTFGHATSESDVRRTLEQASYQVVATPDFLPRQSFVLARARQPIGTDSPVPSAAGQA